MAKPKGDGKKGDGKGGLLRVVVEGAAESMTKVIAEKGLAALFGGGAAPTPAPAPTPAAAPSWVLDIKKMAMDFLGPRRAELHTYAAQRTQELDDFAAAHRALKEDE